VLQRAHYTDHPAIRAAALLALANVVKVRHINALLPFMRDPAPEVRRAAAVAILSDARVRWPDIRSEIRQALGSPYAAKDGPLPCSGNLPDIALQDLIAWSGESGQVGRRATQTLVRHCQKAINEDGSQEAVERVSAMVASPNVPPAIRVELAHRLELADAFPVDVAARLLGPANPTMLRVLAAGTLLGHTEDPQAVEVLREAAKQPNREITLAAAKLVQKYLSVDLGLPVGGQLPPTNSREATEIARRVQRWACDPGSQSGEETPADAIVPIDVAYY
jgi:HEAT repeat protein